MVLTDTSILNGIKDGNIIINPFNIKDLKTNSYDLHLSNLFKMYTSDILDCKNSNDTITLDINNEEYGGSIILMPNTLYLASTIEYTETNYPYVPILHGKSSLGRLGLFIHITAGFGDVGFKGHWTLELYCIKPIKVYYGMPICQISYHQVTEKPLKDYGKQENSKYNYQSIEPIESKMYKNF